MIFFWWGESPQPPYSGNQKFLLICPPDNKFEEKIQNIFQIIYPGIIGTVYFVETQWVHF